MAESRIKRMYNKNLTDESKTMCSPQKAQIKRKFYKKNVPYTKHYCTTEAEEITTK